MSARRIVTASPQPEDPQQLRLYLPSDRRVALPPFPGRLQNQQGGEAALLVCISYFCTYYLYVNRAFHRRIGPNIRAFHRRIGALLHD